MSDSAEPVLGERLTPEQVAALSFEEALDRLEETIALLEAGDLSLEDSLCLFEEGMLLRQACSQRLQAAEARVETVLADEGRSSGALDDSPEPDADG